MDESWPSRVTFRDDEGNYLWFNPREAVSSWELDDKLFDGYINPSLCHMPSGAWIIWDENEFVPMSAKCVRVLSEQEALNIILESELDPGPHIKHILESKNIGREWGKVVDTVKAAESSSRLSKVQPEIGKSSDSDSTSDIVTGPSIDEHFFSLWDSVLETMLPFAKICDLTLIEIESLRSHLQEQADNKYIFVEGVEGLQVRNSDEPIIHLISRQTLESGGELFKWIGLCKQWESNDWNGGIQEPIRSWLKSLREMAEEAIRELQRLAAR